MNLVAAKPVGRAELAYPRLHLMLQRLQPRELFLPPGQPFQIRNDQRAHRGVTLRSGDPGIAVDVIWNEDGVNRAAGKRKLSLTGMY